LFNNAFEALTGYKKESMLGRNIDVLFPPLQKTEILQTIERATRGEKWESVEVPILCKEKETRIALWNSANIQDKDGNIVATIAQGQDITERKKAEEELFDEVSLMQLLLGNHPDFIYFKDSEARFQRVSKRFCNLFELDKEDIIGKTDLELFPEEVAKQTYSEDLQIIKTGKSIINKEENAKGTWVLTTKMPRFDKNGKIVGLFGISRDITDRKKAEEELKSSEQKFRGLVEDSAAAIATIDLKGRLTYVNKALADLSGYSVQELSGRAFKDFVHPDDRGRLVRLFLKIIVLRRQPRKFELRALRKDGAILHLMCRPTRLETAGKTVGFQAILIQHSGETYAGKNREDERKAECCRRFDAA
jgi:PAS domain S-box-containing protein